MAACRYLLVLCVVALLGACGGGGSPSDTGGGGDTAAPSDATGDAAPAADTADAVGPGDAPGPGPDAAGDVPGPGPDAGADTGGAAPSPADWCTRWPQAYCALLARCPLPILTARGEAECRAAFSTGCSGAALAAGVDAGRLAFDGAAAAECLAAVADLDCATFGERLVTTRTVPDPACAAVWTPLVAAPGDCLLGYECAPGAFCAFGEACPGTCTAFAAVDAACGVDTWCDPEAATCVDGACAPLPEAEDAACVGGRCRLPLACDPATGTCRTPGLAGAPCGGGAGVCYPGLLCFGGTCAPLRGDGESCFASTDCGDLVCVGGTCQAPPEVDEPCYEYRCAGAWCDTAAIPPTCRAWPAEGAACAPGNRCASEHFCDAGTCRPRRAAGAACASHLECAEGRCYGGECRAADEAACDEP